MCYIDNNKTVNKYSCKGRNDLESDEYELIKTTEILKHSKNIIDLIEVGDYVNGYKVVETFIDNKKKDELWLGVVVSSKMIKEPLQEYFNNEMIKSIVTHEQFETIEYKVEV